MSRCRGLTFIEMIVVIAIFMGLSASLLTALLVGRTSQISSEAYIQVQEEARRFFDEVVRELHEAGNVNNGVAIGLPGVQRLDFQIVRSYNPTTCAATGGICWGSENANDEWIHYVLDQDDAGGGANPRYMRCVTAVGVAWNAALPVGFVGCRVLANRVNTTLANTSFTYDDNNWVTIRLQTTVTSAQLPGGTMGLTAPLLIRVQLRNTP